MSTDSIWQRREDRRRELVWILRSRVATVDEMEEVNRYGVDLMIPMKVKDDGRGASSDPYKRRSKERELNALLLHQFKMRIADEAAQTTH